MTEQDGAKPRLEQLSEKKLLGKRRQMSFVQHNPKELWQSFMPQLNEIKNRVRNHLYSLEVYPPQFFYPYNPQALFDKWAAVEVSDYENIPQGMETLVVPAGLYAVFLHKGLVTEAEGTYRYIFEKWLPFSSYLVDDRPHFAVMGDRYKRDDPASEEEVWIPILPKE